MQVGKATIKVGCALRWVMKLAPELDAHGFRWAIGGAVAVQACGIDRETDDVDIFVHDADRRILQLFRDHDGPSGMISSSNVRVAAPCDRGAHVDLVFASFAFLENAIARATRVDVDGVALPFLTPVDPAVCKALSESPKDGRDLAALVSAAGGASVEAVRNALPSPLPERTSVYVRWHQNVPLALGRLAEL